MKRILTGAALALAIGAAPLYAVAQAASPAQAAVEEAVSAYSFSFPSIDGGELDFSAFAGKPMLVVNTASMCGYTKQYGGLQTLYDDYKDQDLVVVGIPSQDFLGQEYDSAEKTKEFCEVNFGITFPMATKQHVKGDDAHPFYQWARGELGESAVPKWNFHKILIDRDGRVVSAYKSKIKPQDNKLVSDLEALL